MDDGRIIELYWARDESAIAESEGKYGGFCRGVAMNILGSREDSEECVLDTWHRAWRAIPPARPNSLRAFFGRIARNIALDRYRREHAQKRFPAMERLLGELEDCVPDSLGSVERAVEAARLSELISAWLATLEAADRKLFVRRYWYGDPLALLAGQIGMKPNALAQKMLRLRLELKAILEREEAI